MSDWDTPAGASDWKAGGGGAGDEWKAGGEFSGAGDAWNPGAETFVDGAATATNGEAAQNGGGDADFKCRRCGESGHMARQCPSATEGSGNDGKCFNCGEEGHSKADCTNPRVFTGTCRICEKVGHPAALCPDKPPVKCFNCKEEGHLTSECTSNRVFDKSDVADMSADDAWNALQKADHDCDLDDFRTAFKVYSKAAPEATYDELERAFRMNGFNVYLIATEKELPKTHTYVNLQGELDKTYQVGFHLSDKPKRETQKQGWPEDSDDNLERLKNAGLPMDRGIPKCTRCDELGHTTRGCPAEATENPDKVEVKCVNCNEVGHRARDCSQARKDRFTCRNCKQPGHAAAECTEPRSAEGVECRKCSQMGHFSKDCPTGGGNTCRNCGEEGHMSKECDKPRNPATVTCRNCEQLGHFTKECPEKKDWSKVKCNNCGEMGHTKARCKQPISDDNGGLTAGGGGGYDNTGGASFDNAGGASASFDTPAAEGQDEWGTTTGGATAEMPSISAGGW